MLREENLRRDSPKGLSRSVGRVALVNLMKRNEADDSFRRERGTWSIERRKTKQLAEEGVNVSINYKKENTRK